jgi:hypothetical protein
MDPRPTEPDEPLGAENEAQWDRVRSQIDLAESFWLGFVFSPSPRTAAVLRERAERELQAHGKTLLLIQPATPAELRGVLLRLVDDEDPAKAGCIWVEAVRSDSPGAKDQPWTGAWDELFLRMNVRRDMLRRRLPGGLVFAAPPEIKPRVREAAPDLWHVRLLVIDLQAVRSPVDVAELKLPALDAHVGLAPDPEFALKEAARRGALGATKTQALALVQAAKGLLAQGKAREAREAALNACGLLQGEGGVTESTALATLARAEVADEDHAAAADHIEQAITLRQRADPEGVPLDWYILAGRVAVGLNDATTIFRESERLARARLAKNNTLDNLRDLVLVLGMLGTVKRGAANTDAAAAFFEESIALARELVARPEGPSTSREILAVILRALANVHRARGEDAAARAAEEEAASLDPPPV